MSEGVVGGITKWTKYILDYSTSNNTGIELEQYYPPTKVACEGISIKRVWRGVQSYMPLLRGLIEKLKQQRYEVVHFSTSASFSLIRDILTVKIAQKYGAKTVIHFHFGRIPQIFQARNWEYRMIDILIKMTDMVMVMDKASFNTLREAGYKNISLIPNPLSTEVAEMIERNKTVMREPRKLVFAGHVIKTKGILELVSACKNISNINLEIYGRIYDEMYQALIAEAGQNHHKWLSIKGECQLEEVIKAMLSAGIFVLPSHSEGFPNVIIESMACGCPIVATPVGAIPEMLAINGVNKCGICVPIQNVKALEEAITEMLENSSLAKEYGNNAKCRVEKEYAIASVWSKMSEVWKNI